MSLINIDIIETNLYNAGESKTETAVKQYGKKTTGVITLPSKEELNKLTEEQLAIHKMVAQQKMDTKVFNSLDNTLDLEEGKITYVTASNGLFRLLRTPIAIFSECVTEFDNPLYHLNELKTGFQLLIPKMDMSHLIKVLTYYRDIYDKDKTEASVLFFWNHTDDLDFTGELAEIKNIPGISVDGRLITYVPIQKNSSALSDFEADVWVPWLRQHTTGLLETHSHHTMDAFWSGTDDANENMNQFYLVWGRIKDDQPANRFRYCYMGHKYEMRGHEQEFFNWPLITVKESVTTEVKTTKVLDMAIEGDFSQVSETETNESILSKIANQAPQESTDSNTEVTETTQLYPGPFAKLEYPSDWISQHKSSTPTYNYGKHSGYGGATGWGGYGSNYGNTAVHSRQNKKITPFDYSKGVRSDFKGVVYDKELGKYVDASGK